MILLTIMNQALPLLPREIHFAKQGRQQIWQNSFCYGTKFRQVVGKDAAHHVQDVLDKSRFLPPIIAQRHHGFDLADHLEESNTTNFMSSPLVYYFITLLYPVS